MSFIFDKLAHLNKRFKVCFELFFQSISEQNTVSEVLKTWYFLYSAFFSAGQWMGFIPRPPGYATGHVLLIPIHLLYS